MIAVDSWQEAAQKMRSLLKNPQKLSQKRTACSAWWHSYKEKLKKVFAESLQVLQ